MYVHILLTALKLKHTFGLFSEVISYFHFGKFIEVLLIWGASFIISDPEYKEFLNFSKFTSPFSSCSSNYQTQ